MIAVNDVREGALLALADRREGRTRAADTLCPGFVRTSTSTTGRARRMVSIDDIWSLTANACDANCRVVGSEAGLTSCPVV